MSQSKKYSKYIDLKTNGRLFPSWIVANFSKYKLPEIMKDPNIDACNLTKLMYTRELSNIKSFVIN